jgi:protein-S-isoprenylcysteine O-methyltransferase Ste14
LNTGPLPGLRVDRAGVLQVNAVNEAGARRRRAAIGSAVFFILAPGIVGGAIPWLLTDWRVQRPLPFWTPIRLVGAILLVTGAVVLVRAFVQFVEEGSGTPAPVAPTERLVVSGLYRYIRNPMYLAVLSTIVGQALLLGQPILLVYGLVVAVAFVAFVAAYEEPTLRRRYGPQYDAYRREVPGWWPRMKRR